LTSSPIKDDLKIITKDTETPFIRYKVEFPFINVRPTALRTFKEEVISLNIEFDLRRGLLGRTSLFDLGAFEVVNAHQWEGVNPYSPPNMPNAAEPALWDIATVDKATGERFLLIRTHAPKNEVFRVLSRLNAVTEYARSIAKPWEDVLRAEGRIPMPEMQKLLAEHPPVFGFGDEEPTDLETVDNPAVLSFQLRREQARKLARRSILSISAIVIGVVWFFGPTYAKNHYRDALLREDAASYILDANPVMCAFLTWGYHQYPPFIEDGVILTQKTYIARVPHSQGKKVRYEGQRGDILFRTAHYDTAELKSYRALREYSENGTYLLPDNLDSSNTKKVHVPCGN
jgi:hypothetical protein